MTDYGLTRGDFLIITCPALGVDPRASIRVDTITVFYQPIITKQTLFEILLHGTKLYIVFDTCIIDDREVAEFAALTSFLGFVKQTPSDWSGHLYAGSGLGIGERVGAGLAGVLKATAQTERVVSACAVDLRDQGFGFGLMGFFSVT